VLVWRIWVSLTDVPDARHCHHSHAVTAPRTAENLSHMEREVAVGASTSSTASRHGAGGGRSRRRWLLAAALAAVATAAAGGAGFILAGSGDLAVHVGPDTPATAMDLSRETASNSPGLVADPVDSRFVVMANRLDYPDFGCALQLSGDGGQSWVPARPVAHLPDGVDKCYAPEVAFDRTGTLYYLFVGLAGAGNQPVGAYLTSSIDEARTFAAPHQVLDAANFGVRMAIDRSWGARGRIHLVWLHAAEPPPLGGFPLTPNPILAAHSDDGGATFSLPVQVSDAARSRVVAPALALGPRHRVSVAYYDLGADTRDYAGLEGPVWDGSPWSLVLAGSSDGGASFGPGQTVDDRLVPAERVMLVFTMPPPSLALSGTLTCLAWEDGRNGDDDVFARCGTSASRWGRVVRVNHGALGDGHRQYLPAISIAPNHRVDVVYLDRADPLGVFNTTQYTFSTDEGRTFARSRPLTDEGSNAGIGAHYGVMSAAGQTEFGSRLGLLSERTGLVAAWPDTRNSLHSDDQDVLTARVSVRSSGSALPWLALFISAVAALVAVGAAARRERGADPANREEAPRATT
jgi:hypothetical protein